METCKDCATPITQPGHGRPRVRCAACVARGAELRRAARRRELSPENRATYAQTARERLAARTPEQRAARAQRARDRHLQRNYGIGVAEFDALLAAQDGRCAICGTDAPNGHGWQVDHDHESGAVRGILCHGCNVGIGHLNDDPALLRAATAYLESTR